jgi:hypothetical protein
MKEIWEQERQHKMEVEFAYSEGTHDALPESLLESHELIRRLQHTVDGMVAQAKAPGPKWRERLWAFSFGVFASLIATGLWPRLILALPFLQ